MRLTSIVVNEWPPIKKFEVVDLSDVVVVAGPNGVGKTRLMGRIMEYLSNPQGYPGHEPHWVAHPAGVRGHLPKGGSTCAMLGEMVAVGLRELRQDASDLVRRVEGGEEIEITVAGRPAARLVPASPRRWQRWVDIAGLFAGRPDPNWAGDRELIDQTVGNPWERVGESPS